MINRESQEAPIRLKKTKARLPHQAVYNDYLEGLDQRVKKGVISAAQKFSYLKNALVRRETEREESLTDALTQLPNRRGFDQEYKKAIQSRKPFGLLIADVDHFKDVNDTYGHPVGDVVLVEVARRLKSNVREEGAVRESHDTISRLGTVGRWGGEEFAMLIDVSSAEDLRNIAERIRISISSLPFAISHEGKEIQKQITVSIGGGIYTVDENSNDFIGRVDKKALYEAKGEGRNKTVILMTRKIPEEKAA